MVEDSEVTTPMSCAPMNGQIHPQAPDNLNTIILRYLSTTSNPCQLSERFAVLLLRRRAVFDANLGALITNLKEGKASTIEHEKFSIQCQRMFQLLETRKSAAPPPIMVGQKRSIPATATPAAKQARSEIVIEAEDRNTELRESDAEAITNRDIEKAEAKNNRVISEQEEFDALCCGRLDKRPLRSKSKS
ncbi:hypothetical protein SBOR_4686 [Sclerotinia borealis F-4128]|uniref:Uncharacterized protein n=1 Tax=Sclerotinia borealis (strain F-4128) TaxID=1432307 RepID=W9CDV4_SCLBF|nr:hypothetical protein SBOR_4686 [Sclerotinia borealis F-4128]